MKMLPPLWATSHRCATLMGKNYFFLAHQFPVLERCPLASLRGALLCLCCAIFEVEDAVSSTWTFSFFIQPLSGWIKPAPSAFPCTCCDLLWVCSWTLLLWRCTAGSCSTCFSLGRPFSAQLLPSQLPACRSSMAGSVQVRDSAFFPVELHKVHAASLHPRSLARYEARALQSWQHHCLI